jgi:methyl-accepting chemotaxis protein
MDESTQQNAAMVEETSAAARTLTTEVSALGAAADRFNTQGTDGRGKTRLVPGAENLVPNFAERVKPLPKAAVRALIRPN